MTSMSIINGLLPNMGLSVNKSRSIWNSSNPSGEPILFLAHSYRTKGMYEGPPQVGAGMGADSPEGGGWPVDGDEVKSAPGKISRLRDISRRSEVEAADCPQCQNHPTGATVYLRRETIPVYPGADQRSSAERYRRLFGQWLER